MHRPSRRTAIQLSAKGFLSLTAVMPFLGYSSSKESEAIQWEIFLKKISLLAPLQFNENWDQKKYCLDISKIIKTLNLEDHTIKRFIRNYKNANKKFPEIRKMHKEQNFMVSLLEFEPGEKIPLHNHPDMTGVIFCTKGRINIQNYDLQEQKSSQNKLLLKQTATFTMKPNDTAYLTAKSGNIHALQTDTFTRLIDVFTPPYNKDRIKRSQWYTKSKSCYEKNPGLFEAEYLN